MLELLDLVDADFRHFYGTDGLGDGWIPGDLTGPRFVKRCEALVYMPGAVHGWLERQANESVAAESRASTGNNQRSTPFGGTGEATAAFDASPGSVAVHKAFAPAPQLGQLAPVFETRTARGRGGEL